MANAKTTVTPTKRSAPSSTVPINLDFSLPSKKRTSISFSDTTPKKKARGEKPTPLEEISAAEKNKNVDVPPDQRTPKFPNPPPDGALYSGYSNVRLSRALDGRICGSTWTNVKTEDDIPDRHELFLLGDGEKKVEVEAVTQIANAAIFHFKKEDHTLANMLRDKLFRSEHVTFAAYKVPHPLFANFDLRVHTDGDISPKEAVVKACQELVQELQILDQEFTKEFELRKITGQGPGGLDLA